MNTEDIFIPVFILYFYKRLNKSQYQKILNVVNEFFTDEKLKSGLKYWTNTYSPVSLKLNLICQENK